MGLEAVARPSIKLLGVSALMTESMLGCAPMGRSFSRLATSQQTVRNLGTDQCWLLTEKWIARLVAFIRDSTAP